VWIEDTIIHGNNSGSSGGGIYYDPSFNSGEMQLNRVTVSQNVAPSRGAGIYNNGGTMSLINVTISGNQAVGPLDMEGCGIYQYEGAFLLVNSTIAQNEAYDGGGIYNLYGDIFLENTILANNIASGDPNTHNCFGTITSNGYNLEDGAFCNLSMLGDLTNIDPLLMPLSMNGGETAVHPLAVGSPAIDAGNNLSCPLTDQRGGIRPVDGDGDNDPICDIGAYEYGALQLTAVDDVVSTQINMPILIDVLLNDMPGENGLPMLDSVGEPLSGTTVISGSAILYIPISDFTGIDNFPYIITDGVVMDTAVVTVTILPLIAPTAVSDVITTTQNVSILIDVLANDMPGNGGNLILDDLGNPLSGTATISGTFVLYAPNLDMIGTDAFTYTISDGVLTDTTVVTVTVLPMDNQGFVYLPMVLKPEE
jgi:hypothetical protein